MSVAPTSPAPQFENPWPFRFTREQYYRLGALGFFDCRRVELLDGEVFEKYPDDPIDLGSRPFRFSREQYYRIGELGFFDGRRVELVRREIVLTSPINEPHVSATSLTADALKAAFGPGHYVRVQTPLNLGTIDPEPDVAVVPGGPRDYTIPPTTALLVVEVADTSLHYDITTKAEEYATAGISDYWVLDLANHRLLVFRDPAPIAVGGTAYRTHLALGPADSVSPLAAPGGTIAVTDLLP